MVRKLFGVVAVLVLGLVGGVGAGDEKKPDTTEFETKYLKFIRDKEKEASDLKEKIKKTEAEYVQAEKDELAAYTKFGGAEKFGPNSNKPKPDELVKAIKAREDKQAERQQQGKTLGAITQDRRAAIKELKDKVGIVRLRELGIND